MSSSTAFDFNKTYPLEKVENFVAISWRDHPNRRQAFYFTGKDEAEARKRLNEFLKMKNLNHDGSVSADKNVSFEADAEYLKDLVVPTNAGKGQCFVGKVWMLNHKTKARARVSESEVDAYKAKGFVNGGPKTKFI